MRVHLPLLIAVLLSVTYPVTAETTYAGYLNNIGNTLQHNGAVFTGTLAPLVNCINLKANIDLPPVPADLESLLRGLGDGSIEIALAMVADEQRNQIATASQPILTLPAVLISRDAFDPKQLSDVMVSTAQGSAYSTLLKEADAIILYSETYLDALDRFFAGDVEAAVVPKASLSLSAEWIDENLYVTPFSEDQIVYYVSHQSPQAETYLSAIDYGISQCQVTSRQ